MEIEGTSTLHDWVSTVDDFDVTATLTDGALKNVRMTARVESIKSGKGGMDKNTYKAMNSSEYPEIQFTADELKLDGPNISGTGSLTIAGKTNSRPIQATYESWSEDSYMVRGSATFNMSSFGVEPPKAMMGTIKTGDEVTIRWEVALSAN